MLQPLMETDEIFAYLGIGQTTFYRIMAEDDTFPVRKIRGRWKADPEELAELLPADLRTVYRYEASKGIRPDILARLAQVLKSRQLAESYCDQCPVRNVKFKKKKGPDNRRTLSIKNLLFR